MAGNATLTTAGDGGDVVTDLWLQSIGSETNVQFDDNQVKRGISHRPIRRAEMYLTFTAIWSLQNWQKMDDFQETIRKHYMLISQGNAQAMKLTYKKDNLEYSGWIDSVQKQFIRFQDVFVRFYRMNILLPDYLDTTTNIAANSNVINPNSLKYYSYKWYEETVAHPLSDLKYWADVMNVAPAAPSTPIEAYVQSVYDTTGKAPEVIPYQYLDGRTKPVPGAKDVNIDLGNFAP